MLNTHEFSRFGFLLLVFVVVMNWSVGVPLAEAYAPVDDLVTSVNQLLQTGEIYEVVVMANLIVSLQTIGTVVDEGNTASAKDLLQAFIQEVQSLSGVLMTAQAAEQLVDEATTISATL